jgi:transcriptional regulator with XRE-family HTH domain
MAIRKSLHSVEYAAFLRVLRQVREDAGLTQADLARKIGNKQTYVSKCERGQRRIDVIELKAFCSALGIEMADFLTLLDAPERRRRPQKCPDAH